jgi:hypothetical protein
VLDKFAAIQMLDVHFPTTDGRALVRGATPRATVVLELSFVTLGCFYHRFSGPRVSVR